MARILVTECRRPSPSWRHYMVVTDGRVAIVEMVPALLAGWNVRCVTVQGPEAWDGTEAEIVAWKTAHVPGYAPISEVSVESLGAFGPRLLDIAARGSVE